MKSKLPKCMGWHGVACDSCRRLAKDRQDEDRIEITRDQTKGHPCPEYVEAHHA